MWVMIYPTNIHIINIGDDIMWVEDGDFNREWDWVSALEVAFEDFDCHIKEYLDFILYTEDPLKFFGGVT